MTSLKLSLSAPGADRLESRSDLLVLKPRGSTDPGNLDARPQRETLSSRVA